MHTYKLHTCSPLGERHPEYGQSYWASANDQNTLPFKFSSRSAIDFKPGEDIEFESYEVKKSSKGTDYWQLKKVRLVGGAPTFIPENKKTDQYQDGMAWGNALNNATQLVINFGGTLTLSDATQAVLGVADLLITGRDTKAPVEAPKQATQPEYIPDANDTDNVRPEDIPF